MFFSFRSGEELVYCMYLHLREKANVEGNLPFLRATVYMQYYAKLTGWLKKVIFWFLPIH